MSNQNVEEKKAIIRPMYTRGSGSGQSRGGIRHESVLIDVIMLCVLADLFCLVPALLITNGEQQ